MICRQDAGSTLKKLIAALEGDGFGVFDLGEAVEFAEAAIGAEFELATAAAIGVPVSLAQRFSRGVHGG